MASFDAMALPDDDDWAAMPASRRIPVGIIVAIAICVALQLASTIALPNQGWSMPLGLVGLALVCTVATLKLGARRGQAGWSHTVVAAITFVLLGLNWSTWIYDMAWRGGEQSICAVLTFIHQVFVILVLIPRGPRYGTRWPIVLDAILGLAFCALLTTTIWPQLFVGPVLVPPRYLSYLQYLVYAGLGVASLIVQRRAPPMFLPAFAIMQCLYALTSIVSVELAIGFQIPRNSPIWVYGDLALIAYPLIAAVTVGHRRVRAVPPEVPPAPNQIVPFLIAMLVLCLAFGSAHRQQMMAALVGVAGLLLYSFRVAFVTRQYSRVQEALVAAGRMRVESLIDVVHELRSPLASVVLNASALARAADIPARLRPRVATIASRCDTVTRLLNDVLDLERIEAGLMDISIAPMDVSAVCRDAVHAVATTAEAAGITLRGPGDGVQPLLADGDSGLLVRVLVNLLDNAIRFTPAGGLVTVRVGDAGRSEIAVIVEDSGVGVSADARATLFQRFGHAGEPVNGARGSGLGLSISSSAIAAMHGRLDLVARDDGPGTRATILLNRRPQRSS